MAPGPSRTWAAIALLALTARAELTSDVDVGYDLLVTGAGPDVNRTCFKIPELPSAAIGSFFISGPAKFELGGYKFQSFFDGYGRINRFEMKEGEVCFAAKLMQTDYLHAAEELGRISNGIKFMGTIPKLPPCPLTHPLCFFKGASSDNNWVNMLPTAAGGLLLTDSASYIKFDYETLDVQGLYPWSDGGASPKWIEKGHAATVGSAHPLRRPKTESTYFEIVQELDTEGSKSTSMTAIYSIDAKTMVRDIVAQVPTKGPQYLHSFGVSENYVVLPCNMKLGLPDMSLELIKVFQAGWDGIHVVNVNTKEIQIFDTEPFFHTHIVNTVENETGITLDLGTFAILPFGAHNLETDLFLNKTARDERANGQKTERMHMHLAGPLKGQVTRQSLGVPGRQVDFYKINDLKNGMPYCIYYAVEWFHDDKSYASMAIIKHDLCEDTRTYWAKENMYPSEPFFVPLGNEADAEDHGLIVFTVLNGPRGASDFVIMDAKTMKEISVVQLPVHIPFTAHGQFIPKAAQDAVKVALAIEHPQLSEAIEASFQI